MPVPRWRKELVNLAQFPKITVAVTVALEGGLRREAIATINSEEFAKAAGLHEDLVRYVGGKTTMQALYIALADEFGA